MRGSWTRALLRFLWQPAPVALPDPAWEAERAATYPPAYPAGWYVVARSAEVGTRPLSISALGRKLVAFRDAEGAVAVLDAHCPHLGADLSDGHVEGGCVVCPFHAWKFHADGSVADIPYADRKPTGPITRAWHTEERYGLVFAWLGPVEGRRDPAPEPTWPLPRYPRIDQGALVHRGDHDADPVRVHLIEMAENAVDPAHFDVLHSQMRLPGIGAVPGIGVHHETSWEPDPVDRHVSWFRNHVDISLFGTIRPSLAADATVRYVGPGGLAVFTITLPGLGDIVMFHTHTPLAPLLQQPRFVWYADRAIPRLVVRYVVANWIAQWRQDVRIWERKVHVSKPVLSREDGPVHLLRRWFRQFYGEPLADNVRPLVRRASP